MNFALTPQMIDKISFAMEDQKERYAVNVDSGELAPASRIPGTEAEAWVTLPAWGSAEGFHLMESFVTSLDNPAWREQLSRALTTGRGVFRAFKDVLKQNREIEKLWFLYKERRLRGIIVSWYNATREARGLEKLPVEPEETEELVMSDFSFSWDIHGHLADIQALDRDAFFGLFPQEAPGDLEERFREKRRGLPEPGTGDAPLLIAETPSGDLAGFAWGAIDGSTVHIVQLAVWEGLRGIGLGESLLRQFVMAMRERGMRRLTTELMGKSLRAADFFQSVGFVTCTQLMECSLERLPF